MPASPDLAFLKAVSGESPVRHARDEYARALSGLGIPTPDGWLADFRRLFASTRRAGDSVLLFPGAGHPLKQWPLVQYFQLADLIEAQELRPVFVLGPAELERGVVPLGRVTAAPQSLEELEKLILSARFVVGGDTGPMHLAGMLGVPGVSLFGPTSFAQWGPAGMVELSLNLPCSPCTATCADLACESPRCLKDITPEAVLENVMHLELESKIGFQGPGIP
ncbi:MAG: glycosyltransferase family 9 protein [Thermodesulfobacteriota bacterium]